MKLIYISLFYLLLITPAITQWIFPIPRHSLRGVTKKMNHAELTIANYIKGEIQQSFERRLKNHMKLWPYMVRTENQLNVSLFRQIGTSYKSAMILGKQNVLMHRTYIRHANKLRGARKKQVASTVSKLSRLHDALKKRDIQLLLLISPNKPSLYPEHLPNGLKASLNHRKRKTIYEKVIGQLEAKEIPMIDAYKLLQSKKSSETVSIFPASGSHWSDYWACMISSKITYILEEKLDRNIQHFRCEKSAMRPIPLDFDRDHASVANIWFPEPFLQPTIAVDHPSIPSDNVFRPRVTLVGTSFMWSILRYLDHHKVYSTRDFYFYFQTLYQYPGNRKKRLRPKQIDWNNRVLKSDVILLEVNEAWLDKVGYGFIRHILRRLES